MKPRFLVFDYDGTLVDSQGAISSTMQLAFADLGLTPPSAAATRGVIGIALEGAIHRLLPDGADYALAERVAGAYRKRFFALREKEGVAHEPLFDGLRAVLDALKASPFILGIATGKNRRGLVHGLAGHGLSEHFMILKTADDGPSKPHPEILRQAMREVGAEPQETLMIGDTSFDMMMARAAGAKALGVAWGYHPREELLEAGAEQIVEAPAGLLDVVGLQGGSHA